MSIRCGHCRSTHKTVAEVRACSQDKAPRGEEWLNLSEHSQERVQAAMDRRDFRDSMRQSSLGPTMERREQQVDEGFYCMDGTVYKVQIAVHGSGKPYAKALICELLTPQEVEKEFARLATGYKPSGDQVFSKGRWEYARGVVRQLRPEHRLTREQAAELGKLYGCCVRCGATLTREESIERGMGPVCAGKMW